MLRYKGRVSVYTIKTLFQLNNQIHQATNLALHCQPSKQNMRFSNAYSSNNAKLKGIPSRFYLDRLPILDVDHVMLTKSFKMRPSHMISLKSSNPYTIDN